MDEIMLKNAIRLCIGGYLYDTNLTGKDEWEKIEGIPTLLRELVDDYEKEIQARIDEIEQQNDD